MLFYAIFSVLLPRALNDLTGKQQAFTNLQAARQKLSVLSRTKTSSCLLGSFVCSHLSTCFSFILKGWTLDQALLEFLPSF